MTEAIVLVGGLGTRLRPLTDRRPKPMLPVAGAPLVAHQILRARAAGVGHVVLATAYRAHVFATALGDGAALGVTVSYAVEEQPLGTGGAIRNAARFLTCDADDPVLVLNGDIIDGHDITAQVAEHLARGAEVSLYLTVVEDARAFGCVPMAEDGRVTAFLEKSPEPVTDRVNAGCYVFRRGVLDRIPTGRPVSVERETFPALLEQGCLVLGWVEEAYWRDLGTPQAYVRGSADAVLGVVDSPARPGPPGPALVLPGARVSAGARLSGGSSVLAGAEVGPGAIVEASVVMEGARVGAGAVLRSCAVGRDAIVGEGARLVRGVIGDGAHVPAGARPAPGVRLAAG